MNFIWLGNCISIGLYDNLLILLHYFGCVITMHAEGVMDNILDLSTFFDRQFEPQIIPKK